MIENETYEALRPALTVMLNLGPDAEGLRMSQLIALYPEALAGGLAPFLAAYEASSEAMLALVAQPDVSLKDSAAYLASADGNDLREGLRPALGLIYSELASDSQTHQMFLTALNGVRGALRFGIMLIALCAFLPTALNSPKINSAQSAELNRVLQLNASSVYRLLTEFSARVRTDSPCGKALR